MTVGPPPEISFWQAIGMVFETAIRRWRECLVISAAYALLSGVANAIGRSAGVVFDPAQVDYGDAFKFGIALIAAFGTLVIVNVLVYPLTTGALSLIGSAAVYGDDVELDGVVRQTFDRAFDLIGVFLLTVLLILAPILLFVMAGALVAVLVRAELGFTIVVFSMVILIIPIIYVFVRLSLAVPAVIREGLGPLAALKRSWDLVRGAWWWVFGAGLVIGLAGGLLGSVFSLVSSFGSEGVGAFIGGAITGTIGSAISMSLFGVAVGVVYAARARGIGPGLPPQPFEPTALGPADDGSPTA